MSLQLRPTKIERVGIECTDKYIHVLITFPDGDIQHVMFDTDPAKGYIIVSGKNFQTQMEKSTDPDAFRFVPGFLAELFASPEREFNLVSIKTSSLSSANGQVLKADKWNEFFDRIKWHFNSFEHKLKFRAFEVTSHPDLQAREVHAFWPFLTPGTLSTFIHSGKENLNSSERIRILSRTLQWKQAETVKTCFYNNVKIRDFCKLKNSVIRLQDFSFKLFRELIEKIENSANFKTCHITCTKRIRRGANWANHVKHSIHCDLTNRGAPIPGRPNEFRFAGRLNGSFEAEVFTRGGTLFVTIRKTL